MGFHNKYDGHTLKPVLEQVGRWTGKSPKKGKVNKGYRGRKQINRNRNTKTFASKNIMFLAKIIRIQMLNLKT